jgi:hypothetical protein
MARQWLIDSFGTLGVLGFPGLAVVLASGILLLARRRGRLAHLTLLSVRQSGSPVHGNTPPGTGAGAGRGRRL